MSNRSKAILFFLNDILILLMVFSFTSMTLLYTGHENPMSGIEMGIYLTYSSLMLLLFFIEGLYTLETFDTEKLPVSLVRGSTFALFLSLSVFTILSLSSKIHSPMYLFLNSLTLPYLIYISRTQILKVLSQDSYARETVLIGSAETLMFAQAEVARKPYMGFRIKSLFTPDQIKLENLPHSPALIAVEKTLMNHPILTQRRNSAKIEIIDLAYFAEQISGKIPLRSINENWILEHSNNRNSLIYTCLKEILDRSMALLLMVLLIPVVLILIPVLLIVHGRPIFFKQPRTGLNNKTFTLFKLRTMVVNAEKDGAQWSKPGDMRITPLGKWLRRTRLDELPQLYNILKGEMSLVGPRPERPEIIKRDLEPKIPHYNLRHLVKPGVTGWAQVAFRYGFSTEDSQEKLQYDLFYIKNRDILMDIIIIVKTIKTVLTGAGQ